MAKSLISPLLIFMFFSATSIPTCFGGQGHMDIVLYDQKCYPMNKFQKFIRGQVAKVDIFRNHQKNQQIFIVRLTESLVCAVIAHR